MKKMMNEVHLEGRVFQHDLKVKQVQNKTSANFGKDFISGTLDVATDEEGLNVVQVHYTYVTPTTSKGTENRTYKELVNIINGKNWVADGKDEAIKVSIDTAIGLNEFYANDGTLVSQMVNEGGFVKIINSVNEDEKKRNKFAVDMFITKATRVEKDEEKHIDNDYLSLRGVIFNFKNAILPIELKVTNEKGMEDFESLDISTKNPSFIKVWGKVLNSVVKYSKQEEASDWGEAYVEERESKTRDWVITGRAAMPYDYGDESVLTAEELTKAQQDRETALAEIKKRAEEYQASKTKTPTPSTSAPTVSVIDSGFNF